jgi:hypothetical protein
MCLCDRLIGIEATDIVGWHYTDGEVGWRKIGRRKIDNFQCLGLTFFFSSLPGRGFMQTDLRTSLCKLYEDFGFSSLALTK